MKETRWKAVIHWVLRTIWTGLIVLGLMGVVAVWLHPFYETQQREQARALTKLQSSLSALSTRLDDLAPQFGEVKTRLSALSESDKTLQSDLAAITTANGAAQAALSTLKSQLQRHASQLSLLERQARRISSVATKPKSPTASAPKKNKQAVKRPETRQPDPFELLDIQLRGSVLLAIIAPLNARTLQEVALSRKGESFLGWKIIAINPAAIQIKKGTQVLTLEVS